MLNGKTIASGMFATCRCRLAMMPRTCSASAVTLFPRLQADEDRAEVRLVGAGDHAVAADGRERVDAFGLGQDLLDLGQHRCPCARATPPAGSVTLTPKMPWSSSGMKPAGSARAEEAGADGHRGDDDDGQDRRVAPAAVTTLDVAVGGRDRTPRLNQPKNFPSGPRAGPWCGLSSMAAERRRERQRAEGREQHRDGDGQRELLVHLSGEAAEEGDRDEHGREDQRDADDRSRDFLHRLDGRFLRVQPVLDVVHHRLDHDDGVVDDDADGEHEAEHRQRVHREAEHREEDERADQRHGHGEERDDRRPQVLQEDEHHQRDQDDRLDEGVDDRLRSRP